MARKYYAKRARPARRTRRRYRRYARRRRTTNIPPKGQPFPDRYRFNLRYVQYHQLDPASTTFAKQTFFVNSLYDPDYTGTGHQPMGYDQLTPLYNRYVVTGAKITTSFETSSASMTTGTTVGITVHEGGSFYASASQDVETLIEQGKTTYKMLGVATGGHAVATLSRKISMRKEFAVKDIISGSFYSALVNASPTNGMFATIWASASNFGADPPATGCITKIEFTGYFLEPKLLGGS